MGKKERKKCSYILEKEIEYKNSDSLLLNVF